MSATAKGFLARKMSTVASLVCVTAVSLVCLPAVAQRTAANKNSSPPVEQPKGKAFRTPADAAAALYAGARRNDEAELRAILGPGSNDLVNWTNDANQRAEQRKIFADKYDQMHRLVKEPDDTVALYVGAENWPVPIPIVEYKGKWYFDTGFGRQEILYRRIGRNEMEALQVCQALIDAEKDYYSDEHKYTADFISSGDSHNGLYWPTSANGEKSPIGTYLAHAGIEDANTETREPYYGYYYRILLTPNASGSNQGFAVLAFPAEYRSSGVMTFAVQQDGMAYEKDLGLETDKSARQVTSTALDSTWSKVD